MVLTYTRTLRSILVGLPRTHEGSPREIAFYGLGRRWGATSFAVALGEGSVGDEYLVCAFESLSGGATSFAVAFGEGFVGDEGLLCAFESLSGGATSFAVAFGEVS